MYTLMLSVLGLLTVSQGREIGDFGPNLRVVNGIDANVGEFPFQVSLQRNGRQHYCGGSVLSANYVITAGHCVYGEEVEEVSAFAGTINKQEPHSVHQAIEFKLHEQYNPKNLANDIALIKVEPPFEFSELVAPVEFPYPHEEIATNTPVVLTGWGRLISSTSATPLILQKALIYVADQEFCRVKNAEVRQMVLKTNICAYNSNVRRGQCNGDSGGPLSIGRKLVGIVSFSYKEPNPMCASTTYPGVYTRVSEYIDWIVAHATV
ncbi:hypothetical protein TSAR_011380 [Trichomalopsis sarcophagae]|uniref:chymotrypsin n=1 Tax=Trichomalopsis sarcophagae TaxID=543379 RepID=A0A232F3W1_9HYME|nr:hypothetical protein TSAR_011380 [Trichomalopsis sarcophagae]